MNLKQITQGPDPTEGDPQDKATLANSKFKRATAAAPFRPAEVTQIASMLVKVGRRKKKS